MKDLPYSCSRRDVIKLFSCGVAGCGVTGLPLTGFAQEVAQQLDPDEFRKYFRQIKQNRAGELNSKVCFSLEPWTKALRTATQDQLDSLAGNQKDADGIPADFNKFKIADDQAISMVAKGLKTSAEATFNILKSVEPARYPHYEAKRSSGMKTPPELIAKTVLSNNFDTSGRTAPSAAQKGIISRRKLWPQAAELAYSIISPPRNYEQVIDEVLDEWSRITCLKFLKSSSVSSSDLRISFVPNVGHYSNIGTDSRITGASLNNSGVSETMNIDPSDPGFRTNGDLLRGVVRHECGHALGFEHEQGHAGGPNEIFWNVNAVYAYFFSTQGWSPQETDLNVLQKYRDRDIYAFSDERDPSSIMHYVFPSFLVKANTVLPARPNTAISPTDIEIAKAVNGCTDPSKPPGPQTVQELGKPPELDKEVSKKFEDTNKSLDEIEIKQKSIRDRQETLLNKLKPDSN